MKFLNFLLTLFILNSCSILESPKQGAIRKIDRHTRKLNRLYMEWPEFKINDTIKSEVIIDNPILKRDTTILYRDSIRYQTIERLIFEKCKDSSLAKRIRVEVEKIKCIKDSIVIKDPLFKVILTQDSIGSIIANITPIDTTLRKKYQVICPPRSNIPDKFYSHNEFWFLLILFLTTCIAIYIHLKLVK
jgi:hypothetical protein